MHRLTALVLLLVGCSAGRRLNPTAPSPSSLERGTWQARAAFDSAVQAADTGRIATLFAADAFLIGPARDTVRGASAIATRLAELGGGAAHIALSWGREGFELCVGGARERLALTARLSVAGDTGRAVITTLSVFWIQDSNGSIKVAWIALPSSEVQRHLTRAECPSIDAVAWRGSRWAVTVYPSPLYAHTNVQSSFDGVLRDRGWVAKDCDCATPTHPSTPVANWSSFTPPGLVTVEYRVRRNLAAEFAGGRLPPGNIFGARYINTQQDYGHMHLWYSATFAAATISYEQSGFRLGVGPMVQFSHWRLRDSLAPFLFTSPDTFTDASWSEAPLGLLTDLHYQRMVGRRVFLSLRSQMRWFREAKTPATARFSAATVKQGSAFLGAGLGMIF